MTSFANSVTRELGFNITRDLEPQVQMILEIMPNISEETALDALIAASEDVTEALDYLMTKADQATQRPPSPPYSNFPTLGGSCDKSYAALAKMSLLDKKVAEVRANRSLHLQRLAKAKADAAKASSSSSGSKGASKGSKAKTVTPAAKTVVAKTVVAGKGKGKSTSGMSKTVFAAPPGAPKPSTAKTVVAREGAKSSLRSPRKATADESAWGGGATETVDIPAERVKEMRKEESLKREKKTRDKPAEKKTTRQQEREPEVPVVAAQQTSQKEEAKPATHATKGKKGGRAAKKSGSKQQKPQAAASPCSAEVETSSPQAAKVHEEGLHAAAPKAAKQVVEPAAEVREAAKPAPPTSPVPSQKEKVPERCPFEEQEPPVPTFPEPQMNVPGIEHFKAEARKDTPPTRAEKDLMKLRKKLKEVEKIGQMLRNGEKVDRLQLPKIEKKDELEREYNDTLALVEQGVVADAEKLQKEYEAEEQKRVAKEKKELEKKVARLTKERAERVAQLKKDFEKKQEEERLRREQEEKERKEREEAERLRKIEEEKERQKRLEEERIRAEAVQQRYNYTNYAQQDNRGYSQQQMQQQRQDTAQNEWARQQNTSNTQQQYGQQQSSYGQQGQESYNYSKPQAPTQAAGLGGIQQQAPAAYGAGGEFDRKDETLVCSEEKPRPRVSSSEVKTLSDVRDFARLNDLVDNLQALDELCSTESGASEFGGWAELTEQVGDDVSTKAPSQRAEVEAEDTAALVRLALKGELHPELEEELQTAPAPPGFAPKTGGSPAEGFFGSGPSAFSETQIAQDDFRIRQMNRWKDEEKNGVQPDETQNNWGEWDSQGDWGYGRMSGGKGYGKGRKSGARVSGRMSKGYGKGRASHHGNGWQEASGNWNGAQNGWNGDWSAMNQVQGNVVGTHGTQFNGYNAFNVQPQIAQPPIAQPQIVQPQMALPQMQSPGYGPMIQGQNWAGFDYH